jgi:multidrug efflux pump subunit AcrA (membrane-fusion protein)
MNNSTLCFVLAAAALAACAAPEEPAEPPVSVAVRTAKAAVEDVEAIVSAPATVFPLAEAKVAPKVAAPIARLGARMGDRVSEGQPLAWLRSEDLDAQLAEARAQVADAQANLEKVSAGTLPIEIERARGEVERTGSALAEAQQIYERRQTLVAEGALPERDLLLAKTQYDQAQTASRVAQAALESLTSQSQRQDVLIAESRLAQAEARLELAEVQLGYTRIDSPSRGVVTQQFLYPGDMARPDAPIFTVMDLSAAVARGQFPEETTAGLRAGQLCRFTGVDAPGAVHSGKLTVVSQSVDPVRRTVEVWCEIPNPDGKLKAGAFGELAVVTGVHPDAVTVPLAAVELDPDRKSGVVWTVGPDGLAHENHIEPGVMSETEVEIVSGLAAGATVVVEGGYGLSEGVAVTPAEPSR